MVSRTKTRTGSCSVLGVPMKCLFWILSATVLWHPSFCRTKLHWKSPWFLIYPAGLFFSRKAFFVPCSWQRSWFSNILVRPSWRPRRSRRAGVVSPGTSAGRSNPLHTSRRQGTLLKHTHCKNRVNEKTRAENNGPAFRLTSSLCFSSFFYAKSPSTRFCSATVVRVSLCCICNGKRKVWYYSQRTSPKR